jgi:hypothetical protein
MEWDREILADQLSRYYIHYRDIAEIREKRQFSTVNTNPPLGAF